MATNVNFSNPEIIGAYSLDEDRKYRNDMSGLKYLKVPDLSKTSINLNDGDYKDKDDHYDILERIKQMTSYIIDNPEKFVKNKRIDADFVCFRGALKNLMLTPYIKYINWIIKAVKFKGTIYFITETNYNYATDTKNVNDKSYQFGFKFESYVLASEPDKDPKGKSEIVNENEEFCILMSRKIGSSIKIIFGIESDGVDGKKVNSLEDLKNSKLAEVKLQFDTGKPTPDTTKRSWWCQSYIAAIDQVHVGFRDSNGCVKSIKSFDINDLEKVVDVNQCLKFLEKFLNGIKERLKNVDDPTKVYCFKWDAKKKKIDSYLDKSGLEFLPENFVKFMKNLG